MRRAVVPEALAELAAASGFSPAVRAGDFLYLTGATGGDAAGIMPQDVAEQTRNALSKAMTIIAEVGADESNVVEMTSYHLAIDQTFEPVEAEVRRVFSNPLPAWTAVEVAGLRRPGAMVELRLVVYLGDGAR